MTERLTDASRALLEREGPLDEPTADELEAHRARAFAALGLPLPSNLAPPPPESASAPSAGAGAGAEVGAGLTPKLAMLALAVASVAVVATVATVATWQSSRVRHTGQSARTHATQRAPAHMPAPAADVAPTDRNAGELERESPAAAPVNAPTPRAPLAPTRAPAPAAAPTEAREATPLPSNDAPAIATPVAVPSTRTPTPEDALAEQSMIVAAAEAQLRAGHVAEALSLFDRSLARHPSGTLRAESLAGRIAALCRLGRLDAGRGELGRFLDAYPRSPSAPRLRAACGVEE